MNNTFLANETERLQIQNYVMPATALFPCDLALVFGTRHGIPEFVLEMIKIIENDMAGHILISGGATMGNPISEAEILFDELCKALPKLEKNRIILESKAINTGENVQFSMDILRASGMLNNINSIMAVGKISSMRRYMMTIKRWWPSVQSCCLGVNYFGVGRDEWHTHDEFRSRVIDEYTKIPRYIQQGFLVEIEP